MKNLVLAIRDLKTSDALTILSYLSSNALKKKSAIEANKAFLLAMSNRLEDLALAMYERGIPGDINAPIFVKTTKNPLSDRGSRTNSYYGGHNNADYNNNSRGRSRGYSHGSDSGFSSLKFPSYFLLAISLGLHNLVRAMLKVFV